MSSTSVDRVGAKKEYEVGEEEVIPGSVPSSAAPNSRASTSIIDILLASFFLILSLFLIKTQACLHRAIMKLGNGKEVCSYFALVRISKVMIDLRFNFFHSMI